MPHFYDSLESRLVWKIENFSCQIVEKFICPLHLPSNAKWRVVISKGKYHISVHLNNWGACGCEFYCSISFLDSNGTPLICKESAIAMEQNFEDVKEVFKFPKENNFFPNGSLIVECRVWKKANAYLSPILLFVHTRISTISKAIKKNFTCIISEIKESCSNFAEKIFNDRDLEIEICVPYAGQISIRLIAMFFGYNAKIQVFVLDNTGKKIEFGNHFAEFKSENRPCQFNMNLSRHILMQHANKLLVSGSLSLIFTCTFTAHIQRDSIVAEKDIFESTPPTTAVREVSKAKISTSDTPETSQENVHNTALQSFQEMLREGYFSDFKLKVGNRTFPVHKNILGMRSKVFRSMFSSEMKEMQDNCVDIKDVDGDTFHRLLDFVYSDRIDEDMNWKEASSLYAAADFYALEPLKACCRAILEENLVTPSALGVLSLADLHQDQELKSAALDFIFLNDQDIVGTEDWTRFVNENGNLALETYQQLYSRKMNV